MERGSARDISAIDPDLGDNGPDVPGCYLLTR